MPLDSPRKHTLSVTTKAPPLWQDFWVRNVPFVGVYLNLALAVWTYATKYEDVADLIAEETNASRFVGDLVGYKTMAAQDKKVV